MTGRLTPLFGVVLLVLPLVSTTSHAGAAHVSIAWNGTVRQAASDANGDGIHSIYIDAQAKGSFGAKSISVIAEYNFDGFCDGNPAVYKFKFWYGRPISTHQNGDLLWGKFTGGSKCMNMLTGDFYGEVQGEWEGGTGMFYGATGPFTVSFNGKTLTIPDHLEIAAFGAIEGVVFGELTRP